MENWYRIQSALLAAIICAALAIHVLLRGQRLPLFSRFAWFNLNLVTWFLVEALTVSEALGPRLAAGAQGLVGGMLPYTCFGFFAEFADDQSRFARVSRRLLLALSTALVAFAVLAWPPQLEMRLALLAGGVVLALLMSILVMVRRLGQVASRVDRTRLKVLLAAGGLVFSLALAEYLPGLGTSSVGNILVAVYMYFIFQVITLRRVLDLFEFLGRFVVLAGFAIVISLIYALLVGWWRHDLGLFLFNTTIATIVVLILFDPLRNFVEDKLNELVFREKFEFTKQAESLRAGLASVIDVRALSDVVLRRLEASRRVTHAGVYLLDEDGLAYANLGFVGTEPPARLDAISARPFLTRLTEDKLVTIENLESERDELNKSGTAQDQAQVEVLDAMIQTMEELQSALTIAFVSGEQLLGFLNVKDERLRGAYSTEEIKALVALGAQATITIENSRLFDRIRERDRLAALGEMAAGLAHEIRNPLGAIRGATTLLKEDPEQGTVYLGIIEEEVDRLNSVVSQFLSYARPLKGNLDPVDVNQVLERTLTLLKAQDSNSTIEYISAPNLPSIRSDPELLRQVVLNLARNAVEAMGDTGGNLTITSALTWRRPAPAATRAPGQDRVAYIRLRFQDEGPGMPTEVLQRLFIPFYTTKPNGTGLGLAICQRIVRSLGGTIEVSSRVGDGTTFSIYLPVQETSSRTTTST